VAAATENGTLNVQRRASQKTVQGPRIQVPAFAGAGTVNRTPPYHALIRTISINGTRNLRKSSNAYSRQPPIVNLSAIAVILQPQTMAVPVATGSAGLNPSTSSNLRRLGSGRDKCERGSRSDGRMVERITFMRL